MKRGQSTIEYIVLIGSVAAGIIAMLVYAGRGHQGNIRSQADQLGALQYAPHHTTISDTERKNLTSTSGARSATTVTYGNMYQPDNDSIAARGAIVNETNQIYGSRQTWENTSVSEALTGAAAVRNGTFGWTPASPSLEEQTNNLTIHENTTLVNLETNLTRAEATWANRTITEDQSNTTSAEVPEIGTTTTHKTTSETLGDL